MTKIFIVILETEGRTLQEIEDHFSGKKKLPKTLKRKEPVSEIPFPTKFDVSHWESNEKFEKHLQHHKIGHVASNGNGHAQIYQNGIQNKIFTVDSHRKKSTVNDDDYDTPL
jgi:hypothetical protein